MRKLVSRALIALLLCLLLSTTAFADMGPKPSVKIVIDGLEGRRCYATLLSVEESTGPYSASSLKYEMPSDSDSSAYAQAFRAFAEYRDPDGLYFLCTAFDASGGSFTWGYYPPYRFRVALYFPDSGALVTGELLERYAFASSFRASLQPDGSLGAFERDSSPLEQIPAFLLRVAATILIELLIAGSFGYWKRNAVLVILRMNVVTQLLLNLGLALAAHSNGPSGFIFVLDYLLLELAVFVVEAAAYGKRLPKYVPEHPGAGRAVLYAFVANAASFGLGLWLSELLPFMF